VRCWPLWRPSRYLAGGARAAPAGRPDDHERGDDAGQEEHDDRGGGAIRPARPLPQKLTTVPTAGWTKAPGIARAKT
jgi:hypothetical protein